MLTKAQKRIKRGWRNRSAFKRKNAGRIRLSVHRTGKNIYAQIIDDEAGRTLASASTIDKDLKPKVAKSWDMAAAAEVGKLIAARAKDAGVTEVAFDRGAFRYHGRIQALADAAREGGLSF